MVPDKHSFSGPAKAFVAKLETEGLPQIERATVALMGVQDDEIRHDRTGVLYRCADYYFILTAAHNLHGIVKHQIPLYVSLNAENQLPVPLNDAIFCGTEEDCRDVAAVRLSKASADEISRHKTFLAHDHIRLDGCTGDALYAFVGFPMAWSPQLIGGTTVHSSPLRYLCRPYQGSRNSTTDYDPQVHFLLEFSRDAIEVADHVASRLPEPHGISGCGIWRLCEWSARGLDSFSPSAATLVAIQHTWFATSNYIQTTQIAVVLGRILAEYPELRSAMSLAYPR